MVTKNICYDGDDGKWRGAFAPGTLIPIEISLIRVLKE